MAQKKEIVHVEHCKGINGFDKVILREVRGCSVEAKFVASKAIRGGIPICFSQFSNLGPLEAHGFARTRVWSIDHDPLIFLRLALIRFEVRLRVTLGPGGDLMLTSRIRNMNTDGKPLSFTFAYHTYLAVTDISEVRVEGVETLEYLITLRTWRNSLSKKMP